MELFEKQIKQRIQNDDEALVEAFEKMAEVVMGKSALQSQMEDRKKQSQDAIEDILEYYHIKPQELPKNIEDVEGQLEYLLRPSGIMKRNIILRESWYKDGVGAILASTTSGNIVALLPSGIQGYTYYDHEKGKMVKITKYNASQIRPEAMCFYKPLPMRKLTIKDLLAYMMEIPSTMNIVMIVLMTATITLLGTFLPKVNNLLFSDVVNLDSKMVLLSAMILMIGVTVSSTLVTMVKTMAINKIKTKISVYIEAAAMTRMLSLPVSFFRKYTSGELSSRMGAISTLCNTLCDAVLSIGLTSIFSIVYIGQIFKYAPKLAWVSIGIIFVMILFSLFSSLFQIKIGREKMHLAAQERGLIYSILTGTSKIKLAGAEKRAFTKWAQLYTKEAKLAYAPPKVIMYQSVISTAITLFGNIILYYMAVEYKVSVANYMTFNVAYAMVSGAFLTLSSVVLMLANLKPVYEMAKPILDEVPEASEQKTIVTQLNGAIEMNHISFQYDESGPTILDDVSLKIEPGQYVAIVGKTGCGKSTLMRLLLGFEKTKTGTIYYDGKDINSLDLKSLRRKIGVVMQDGKLFQGDLYSNIVISAPWLTEEDAWEAAKMAGLEEDIKNMPMGMHTLVSEGGGGISGGQRQRMIIARAIVAKPNVLFLDEATSALDNLTQKIVSDSLEKLNCTRIVIAHRLSTIRQCDRIIVLNGGKIIEDGTYEQLMEQNGFFKELVKRQTMMEEEE